MRELPTICCGNLQEGGNPGYLCTREHGHGGPHEAVVDLDDGMGPQLLATWLDQPAVEEVVDIRAVVASERSALDRPACPAVHLSHAELCLDCDWIYDGSAAQECPKCASTAPAFALARLINRRTKILRRKRL